MNNKSKRDRSESGRPMFFVGGKSRWYSPYIGFAAAKTPHLAFKLQWIPALAIVTVCYSITSWIATLSSSLILSNSSIHTIPLSANTIAPASKCLSPFIYNFNKLIITIYYNFLNLIPSFILSPIIFIILSKLIYYFIIL